MQFILQALSKVSLMRSLSFISSFKYDDTYKRAGWKRNMIDRQKLCLKVTDIYPRVQVSISEISTGPDGFQYGHFSVGNYLIV